MSDNNIKAIIIGNTSEKANKVCVNSGNSTFELTNCSTTWGNTKLNSAYITAIETINNTAG